MRLTFFYRQVDILNRSVVRQIVFSEDCFFIILLFPLFSTPQLSSAIYKLETKLITGKE